MIIPIRCWTCGNVVASKYGKFAEARDAALAEGGQVHWESIAAAVLDDLGLERFCCRRMLITQRDMVEDIAPY